MDRRVFLKGSAGVLGALAAAPLARAAAKGARDFAATPAAGWAGELPALTIGLTDTGFEFPQPLTAGRYAVTVTNMGTLAESHFGLGKIPDRVTGEQLDAWLAAEGENTDALTFEEIEFVGAADWPPPGGQATGVVDLQPGRYFLFDPFGARGVMMLAVDGEFAAAAEPASDVIVTLNEMTIALPDEAMTTAPVRWKIENIGAMSHEVAVVPVPADFTAEHLLVLAGLPFDATPPAGVPELVYQPIAAIGILAGGQTSWLDVQLPPGRYMAVCMLPFNTGYPHAMDGMYHFFDLA